MAQIKFYRGGQNTSLPATRRDGAIYIKQTGAEEGEIWIDLNQQRIKLGGDKNVDSSMVYTDTTENWNSRRTLVSENGAIYVYEDLTESAADSDVSIPGIKIGDGSAYLIDLPFLTVGVTEIDREFWNNKVDCYAMARDLTDESEDRTLVFTRDYMGPTYADEIIAER